MGNDLAVGSRERATKAVSDRISVARGDTKEQMQKLREDEEAGRRDWQAPRQRREKLSVGGDAVMLWGEERKKGNGDAAARRVVTREKKTVGACVFGLSSPPVEVCDC